MIIDRIRAGGLRSYLQRPGSPETINLGGSTPSSGRTAPPLRGRQWNVSGIQFCIEGTDLTPLFDPQQALASETPLFEIRINKEILSGLFANPFRNRLYTIGGYDDFRRGTFANGRVMEVDSVPTLVSTGEGACSWTSPLYPLPEKATFAAAAWELAVPRQPSTGGFTYSLTLKTWRWGQATTTPPTLTTLCSNRKPDEARVCDVLDLKDVGAFQVVLVADVQTDSYLYERHTNLLGESLGRPLLRAVNLLEPVTSGFAFHSLHELLARATDTHVFSLDGTAVRRVIATVDVPAKLVFSQYQQVNSPGDYEYIELEVLHQGFERLTARLEVEEVSRIEEN